MALKLGLRRKLNACIHISAQRSNRPLSHNARRHEPNDPGRPHTPRDAPLSRPPCPLEGARGAPPAVAGRAPSRTGKLGAMRVESSNDVGHEGPHASTRDDLWLHWADPPPGLAGRALRRALFATFAGALQWRWSHGGDRLRFVEGERRPESSADDDDRGARALVREALPPRREGAFDFAWLEPAAALAHFLDAWLFFRHCHPDARIDDVPRLFEEAWGAFGATCLNVMTQWSPRPSPRAASTPSSSPPAGPTPRASPPSCAASAARPSAKGCRSRGNSASLRPCGRLKGARAGAADVLPNSLHPCRAAMTATLLAPCRSSRLPLPYARAAVAVARADRRLRARRTALPARPARARRGTPSLRALARDPPRGRRPCPNAGRAQRARPTRRARRRAGHVRRRRAAP